MKRILSLMLLLMIVTISFAKSDFTFNMGGTQQSNYFVVTSYENIRGKLVMNVKISGKPYRFILDTGAPTTITANLAKILNPNLITKVPVSDQSGIVDSMSVVNLKEITIGDITFNNIPTLVATQTLIFDCMKVDGFIGSNLLRNSIVRFSNTDKTITITDNAQRLNLNPKQSSDLALYGIQSSPFFWIELKNKKKAREQLQFDSGMDDLYDLSLNHYEQFKQYKVFDVLSKAIGSNTMGLNGTANDTIQYNLRVPSLEINGAFLKNINLQTTSDRESRIGSKILEYGTVTVDYKNKKFYFEPNSEQDLDLNEKSFPMEPVYRENKFFVGVVWDSKSGIKKGDQIIAIDDVNYDHIDPCELINKPSPFKTKDKLTITLKSKNGTTKVVTLEKK